MRKVKFLVPILLAAVLAQLLSGCGSVSQSDRQAIAQFYIGFVKQGTALNPQSISDVYAKASSGQAGAGSNSVTDQFKTINPDFFGKLSTDGVSSTDVGKAYSNILLLSLAACAGGAPQGIDVTFPLDAITVKQDDRLGTVYLIDRSKVTVTFPDLMASMVDRPTKKSSLPPVKVVKDGNGWKVVADGTMFSEIGAPKPDQIVAPAVAK